MGINVGGENLGIVFGDGSGVRGVGLSAREIEILELLSKGLTNKTIGQALGISKFTVRNHVNRILEKLEVCDRTEASTVAIEQGILPTFH
jgi:DNA-binding NarL/FixJ family response regulator